MTSTRSSSSIRAVGRRRGSRSPRDSALFRPTPTSGCAASPIALTRHHRGRRGVEDEPRPDEPGLRRPASRRSGMGRRHHSRNACGFLDRARRPTSRRCPRSDRWPAKSPRHLRPGNRESALKPIYSAAACCGLIVAPCERGGRRSDRDRTIIRAARHRDGACAEESRLNSLDVPRPQPSAVPRGGNHHRDASEPEPQRLVAAANGEHRPQRDDRLNRAHDGRVSDSKRSTRGGR